VIVAVVVVAMVSTMIILVPIVVVISVTTMFFLVTRDVLAVIPVVLDKVDSLPAGMVFVAVLFPMFGVTRRYAQIDRRTMHRYSFNYNGPSVDHLRLRIATDVDVAIKAGLADAYRYSNVGGNYRSAGDSQYGCE
jgi:hypothetical protein